MIDRAICQDLLGRGVDPTSTDWPDHVRAAYRRLHHHRWVVCMRAGGIEVQDCACGARRKLQKGRDGSEIELPYTPAATSADNALIKVAV